MVQVEYEIGEEQEYGKEQKQEAKKRNLCCVVDIIRASQWQ